MPTYQYACTACDERLEVVQKFSDDPLTTCPACSGRLRKVFSPVGVVFKGSGFYRTDSRSESAKSAPAAGSSSSGDGSSAAKDTGSGSSASESKPATTSDSGTTKKSTESKVA